ncbi:MAG: cytochrome c oxidase accessory protein CcoG [gamma proteobacterium symbiont of Taylorina sp.]|nr:cytochrome c oxidase accessory protein CcoG [gamma proteobacterium symbiont of Taylorina sp.]
MAEQKNQYEALQDLYDEAHEHTINVGDVKIHAKRMGGRFRNLKWLANLTWIVFFIGPYLRLGDRQAVLFDIPNRQFHIFNITLLPQDLWMLSFVLLFFAILLAVVTALAGRVWCGYFCFQTVWTDAFTWIEDKLEGTPAKRRKLEKSPWNMAKTMVRAKKYSLWILISLLTGVSFIAWFTDAYDLWVDLFTMNASSTAYTTLALFIPGTFFLAGILREQTCFWLCPYARIQAVMVDDTSIVPSYDVSRGEKRGRLVKGKPASDDQGDCVDCNQCVAVCPTGVDIRGGQQEGCIMCGLCIDACDAVMEKINKPKGLIKYASWDGIMGKKELPILKRPRVWVYTAILLASIIGVVVGLSGMESLELKVLHARQPLFVVQSDGTIQNRYTLKVLNKQHKDMKVKISVNDEAYKGLIMLGAEKEIVAAHGTVTAVTVFVKVPRKNLTEKSQDITFTIKAKDEQGTEYKSDRVSMFIGPNR